MNILIEKSKNQFFFFFGYAFIKTICVQLIELLCKKIEEPEVIKWFLAALVPNCEDRERK